MDMTLCKGACGRKDGFEVGKAIDHDGECRHQLARGHVAEQGPDVARRCCFRVRLDEMVLNTKEAWASKLRAPYRSDGPAGKVAVSGLLQALRLLEVLWIMSAMPSLSCVPRFLSLSALAIRTRSVEV
jgi:hypothetical protein